MESFLVGFSQTSHPHLGYYNTFATVYLFFKSDKNWLQTKTTKTTKSLSFDFERSHLKGFSEVFWYRLWSLCQALVLVLWQRQENRFWWWFKIWQGIDLFVKWRPAGLTGQLFAAAARIPRVPIWSVYFGSLTVPIFNHSLPVRRGGCEALRETGFWE